VRNVKKINPGFYPYLIPYKKAGSPEFAIPKSKEVRETFVTVSRKQEGKKFQIPNSKKQKTNPKSQIPNSKI